MKYIETEFWDIETNEEYIKLAENVIKQCFKEENIGNKIYINIILTNGFYHLMGYDHMEENDKKQMRAKEEYILNKLNISR